MNKKLKKTIKDFLKGQAYKIYAMNYNKRDTEFVVYFENPLFKDIMGVGATKRKAVADAYGNLIDWIDWYFNKHKLGEVDSNE